MCGQMGHLIGPSGIGKAQLGHLVEAIMRNFRKHDETGVQETRGLAATDEDKGRQQGKSPSDQT